MKTQKVGEREILIDPLVKNYYDLFTWSTVKQRSNLYARAFLPDLIQRRKAIMLHHLVMYWVHGYRRMPGREIDHIDGNGLNNKRSNLRFCTSSENKRNMKKTRGTSKYKGVYLAKNGRWVAQIRGTKIRKHLGTFNSEEEAAQAYDAAAKKEFSNFARLNFPLKPARAECVHVREVRRPK